MEPDIENMNVNSVVQLDPEKVKNKSFAACFVTVTEVKLWGIIGYVNVPGDPPGLAFIRATWEEFELIGPAEWLQPS